MRGKRRINPPSDAVFIADSGMNCPRFATKQTCFRETSDAFYAVTKLLCPERLNEDEYVRFSMTDLPVIPETGEFYPRYGAKLYKVSNQKRKALNILFNSIQVAIDAAHAEGIEEGRNLLMGLAKGTLTADQAHGLAPIADKGEE